MLTTEGGIQILAWIIRQDEKSEQKHKRLRVLKSRCHTSFFHDGGV
jgi:hypothetical protein